MTLKRIIHMKNSKTGDTMSHYHSKDGQRWDIDGHYGMIVGQGTQMVNWHKGLMLGEHMSIGRSLFFLLFFGGGDTIT